MQNERNARLRDGWIATSYAPETNSSLLLCNHIWKYIGRWGNSRVQLKWLERSFFFSEHVRLESKRSKSRPQKDPWNWNKQASVLILFARRCAHLHGRDFARFRPVIFKLRFTVASISRNFFHFNSYTNEILCVFSSLRREEECSCMRMTHFFLSIFRKKLLNIRGRREKKWSTKYFRN